MTITSEFWMMIAITALSIILSVIVYRRNSSSDDIFPEDQDPSRHNKTSYFLLINILLSCPTYALILWIIASVIISEPLTLMTTLSVLILFSITTVLQYQLYLKSKNQTKFLVSSAIAEIPAILGLIRAIVSLFGLMSTVSS